MVSKKDKDKNSVVSKGEAKVFRYNAGIDAVVDGNTVQMAFLRDYKGARQTLMEYTWYTKENGGLIKRGLSVSGHGEYGVPTLKEYEVYVALQRIFINKKTENGMCKLEYDGYDDDYLTINFSINELAREMGYSTPSSKTRENLKKSIDILLATTIFSIHEGGLYDIRNKKYIVNKKIGVHLVESMESIDMEEEFNYTQIKLSKFTYEQILNDYKLFYDLGKYNKTKNSISKKIYHLALQWKGGNNFSFANINTLVERIPMVNVDPKYKKRDIKKALKELNDKEIVKVKYDDLNPDKVYFIFKGETPDLKKYNTYKEIQQKYYDMGFDMVETEMYLNIQDIRYIQALLRYIDTKRTIKDIKSYFLKCLNEKIEIPQMYYGD